MCRSGGCEAVRSAVRAASFLCEPVGVELFAEETSGSKDRLLSGFQCSERGLKVLRRLVPGTLYQWEQGEGEPVLWERIKVYQARWWYPVNCYGRGALCFVTEFRGDDGGDR